VERADKGDKGRYGGGGMTQNDQILEALKNGDSLTSIEALNRFGVFRLASRISDLKQDGYIIESERVNALGGKHYSRYYMPTKKEENGQLTFV